MLYIYQIGIILLSIIGTFSMRMFASKNEKVKNIIIKVLSVLVVTFMFLRYIPDHNRLFTVIGFTNSPFNNSFSLIIGYLLVWFSYASGILICMSAFTKLKNIKNLTKYFSLLIIILDLVFFKTYTISLFGNDVVSKFDYRMIFLSLELLLGLIVIGSSYFNKDYFKVSKKEIGTMFITIIPILLFIIPAYSLQLLFGFTNPYLLFKGLVPGHRYLVYGSILLPIIIYTVLKNKSYDVKRESIIYISVALLWTFAIRFNLVSMKISPANWPLHLCHTAMFIVPFSLIFKWDKVFYFTLFVNVIGAFIAIYMPSYNLGTNMMSNQLVAFWINHASAFFMPVLIIMLGLFPRPKIKQWYYSMITFAVYFLVIVIVNAWFSNYDPNVDYFYLNSDYVVSKLGQWAEDTRNYKAVLNIGNTKLVFYPLYQILFFLVYLALSLGMWFFYELLFRMADNNEDRRRRYKSMKQMEKELKIIMNGRSEDEPMRGDNKPCIELKNFSKRYGLNKNYAVKDASLRVEGGQIFGFLGPNGAGKSTIIKSIVGIQTITKGSIEICGYDVQRQPIQCKREVGFVPDHYALFENLTGREYINYIADLYNVDKVLRDKRIKKYVTNFNLEAAFDNQMKTYSHGMKQKITIMSALIHNPKVWILDEPLTGLDPDSIYQVKKCMKDHAKKGNVVFFSSHIIDVVEKICDRIAIIKKGHIICEANTKDLDKQKIPLERFYMQTIEKDSK